MDTATSKELASQPLEDWEPTEAPVCAHCHGTGRERDTPGACWHNPWCCPHCRGTGCAQE